MRGKGTARQGRGSPGRSPFAQEGRPSALIHSKVAFCFMERAAPISSRRIASAKSWRSFRASLRAIMIRNRAIARASQPSNAGAFRAASGDPAGSPSRLPGCCNSCKTSPTARGGETERRYDPSNRYFPHRVSVFKALRFRPNQSLTQPKWMNNWSRCRTFVALPASPSPRRPPLFGNSRQGRPLIALVLKEPA